MGCGVYKQKNNDNINLCSQYTKFIKNNNDNICDVCNIPIKKTGIHCCLCKATHTIGNFCAKCNMYIDENHCCFHSTNICHCYCADAKIKWWHVTDIFVKNHYIVNYEHKKITARFQGGLIFEQECKTNYNYSIHCLDCHKHGNVKNNIAGIHLCNEPHIIHEINHYEKYCSTCNAIMKKNHCCICKTNFIDDHNHCNLCHKNYNNCYHFHCCDCNILIEDGLVHCSVHKCNHDVIIEKNGCKSDHPVTAHVLF